MSHRLSPRIVPPSPITVAIEEDGGHVLAYGVISDISGAGACVWTDAHITEGTTLRFRISFAQPPEVHELVGSVAWTRESLDRSRKNARRCGVEWLGATQACRIRLRELANRAVPPAQPSQHPFEQRWLVNDR